MFRTTNLLLIEDDTRLATMIRQYLEQFGFVCQHVTTGEEGLNRIPLVKPALILLDLMLPDMNGLDVCQKIRSLSGSLAKTPILMLTAKGDPMDRVVGLELGADDYLAKPFEPRELLARIKAILRRAEQQESRVEGVDLGILRFGRLEIDTQSRLARVADKPCDLTSYQFDLLVTLAERAGRVMSREQIMEAVRGRELEAFDRSIDVHMGRIRSAIEDDTKNPKRILTIRGVGYVFAKQQD
jgi:DNA-binding response OmpR family regulator